jgi:hypothetical protein
MPKVSVIKLMRVAKSLYQNFEYSAFITLCDPDRSGHVDLIIIPPNTQIQDAFTYKNVANHKALKILEKYISILTTARNVRLFP